MEVMTRAEAEERRQKLSKVEYHYALRLFRSTEWSAEARIHITAPCDCTTWLDVNVEHLSDVGLNGTAIEDLKVAKNRLNLDLKKGENILEFEYSQSYNTETYQGLQSYTNSNEFYVFS